MRLAAMLCAVPVGECEQVAGQAGLGAVQLALGLLQAQVLALCGHQLTNAPKYVGVLGASYDGALPFGDLVPFIHQDSQHRGRRRRLPGAEDAGARGR